MGDHCHRSVAIPLALFCILGVAGCVTSPDYDPEFVRAQAAVTHPTPVWPSTLGTVGLVCRSVSPDFTLQLPSTTATAAGEGAEAVNDSFTRGPMDPRGAVSVLALLPVMMFAGRVYGALEGVPPEELAAAEAAIRRATTGFNLEACLAQELSSPSLSLPVTKIVPVEWRGPIDVPEPLGRFAAKPGRTLEWVKPRRETHPLGQAGFDTLLVLNVARQSLSGEAGINPPLRVCFAVDIRAIRTADGADIARLHAEWQSAPRHFVEWAQADASPLRTELATGAAEISRQIVRQLPGAGMRAAKNS
jgi:hypothetical protein